MKLLAIAGALFVAGNVMVAKTCKDHDHGHEQEAAHEHEHGQACKRDHDHEHAQGAGVEVSAAAAQSMGVKTVRAEKRRMRTTVPLLGRAELAPDARRVEASPVAGRVTFKVCALQQVNAGDVLFTLEAPELRAKAKEIAVLERRLKVYRDLKRISADLESQLALRQAERETLLAGAEEQDGIVTVRAAVDGRIDVLSVVDGAWVAAGTTVVEIVRPGRMRFVAFVTASEATRLKDGLKAVCGEASGVVEVGSGDASGLTPVYARFGAGLSTVRPGERLRVDCVTDESEESVVAVPTPCIVRIGLAPTVFVRDEKDEDRFVAVKVELGRTNGGWTEVKGLPDDDDLEIVKEGAYELKIALAAQAGAAPTGHFHADGTFHEGKDGH